MCSGLKRLKGWASNLCCAEDQSLLVFDRSAGSGLAVGQIGICAGSAGLKPFAPSKAAAVAHVFCRPHGSVLGPTLCHLYEQSLLIGTCIWLMLV